MVVAQLMASPFLGGPERQVLGLADSLPSDWRTVFLTFSEKGLARQLIAEAQRTGHQAVELRSNWPHYFAAVREITQNLRSLEADILCTNGYKPDIVGLAAACRLNIPAVAIAHGWTGATWKVRLNEALDRRVMRRFDRVVSVSEAQSRKVAAAGVAPQRSVIIPNAINVEGVEPFDASRRQTLENLFPSPPRTIVAAAGRLSPEKGFDVLIDSIALLAAEHPDAGFVLFGDGPLRESLKRRADERRVGDRLVFAGFRQDLASQLPQVDLLAISSRTEGLPVILLEAMAARIPIVATAVGGIPEVVREGIEGLLVPPNDVVALARAMSDLISDPARRRRYGDAARNRVEQDFSASRQAALYARMFESLVAR